MVTVLWTSFSPRPQPYAQIFLRALKQIVLFTCLGDSVQCKGRIHNSPMPYAQFFLELLKRVYTHRLYHSDSLKLLVLFLKKTHSLCRNFQKFWLHKSGRYSQAIPLLSSYD